MPEKNNNCLKSKYRGVGVHLPQGEDWIRQLRRGNISSEIIQAIQEYKAGLGLTYRHMGELLGISHSTIIKWTQGKVTRCRADQRRRLRWFMLNRSKKYLPEERVKLARESQNIANRWLRARAQIIAVAHLCRLSPRLYKEYCEALRELYSRYEEKYTSKT